VVLQQVAECCVKCVVDLSVCLSVCLSTHLPSVRTVTRRPSPTVEPTSRHPKSVVYCTLTGSAGVCVWVVRRPRAYAVQRLQRQVGTLSRLWCELQLVTTRHIMTWRDTHRSAAVSHSHKWHCCVGNVCHASHRDGSVRL